MIYWITAADKNGRVIYNVESEFKGLGEALDSAVNNISSEFHGTIVISDAAGNVVFPSANPEQLPLVAYVGNWNRKRQCFPVRITVGSHNMQWLNNDERAKVSVIYSHHFQHKGLMRAYLKNLGCTKIEPGWD